MEKHYIKIVKSLNGYTLFVKLGKEGTMKCFGYGTLAKIWKTESGIRKFISNSYFKNAVIIK